MSVEGRRDLLDGFTIHVEVPEGETAVDAELDFLSPATFESGFSAGSSATDKLAVISWNQLLLYPKGYKSDDIDYTASLRIPDGWKFGTPLPIANQSVNEIHFARPNMPIRAILPKMRHDGCCGRAGKAELLTGLEGVSSRPVRKIVLRDG